MDHTSDCSKCRHAFEKGVNKETFTKTYECRRFPPTAQLIPAQGGPQVVSFFPPVSAENSCGEFVIQLAGLQ